VCEIVAVDLQISRNSSCVTASGQPWSDKGLFRSGSHTPGSGTTALPVVSCKLTKLHFAIGAPHRSSCKPRGVYTARHAALLRMRIGNAPEARQARLPWRSTVLLLLFTHCEPGADRRRAAAATSTGHRPPLRATQRPASYVASSQSEACGRLVSHRAGMIRLKGGGCARELHNMTAFELGGGPRTSCKRPASALSVALVGTPGLNRAQSAVRCAIYPDPVGRGIRFDVYVRIRTCTQTLALCAGGRPGRGFGGRGR